MSSSGGLSPEQVKALLAKPEKKTRQKKAIDTSIRDYATWFKLAPKAIDDNAEGLRCDNPNCVDLRPPVLTSTGKEIKVQMCIEIAGQKMCRPCFLAGWLLENPDQATLPS